MTSDELSHTLWYTMERTPTFQLLDLQTGGNLEGILAERYEGWGESCEAIASYLADGYELRVSGETVRRWCHDLGLKKGQKGSAMDTATVLP